MATTNPIRQRVLNYVASFGLDGREINRDTIGPGGFQLMRTLADSRIHPWPDGFDYGWFSGAMAAADSEDFRLAGVDLRRVIQ